MEYFALAVFWIAALSVPFRVLNLATGTYKNKVSIGVYAADTVITAGIAIWAAFALWYT